MQEEHKATLEVAKEQEEGSGVVTLGSGVKARLKPVAAFLMSDATSRIKDPDIPRYTTNDGVERENPADPDYLEACRQASVKRAAEANMVMVMFGAELVDGLPQDNGWLKQLQWAAKRGTLDLDGFDLEDPLDLEYLYKRYIAVSSADIREIGKLTGLTSEDVERAEASFRGDDRDDSDTESGTQE
jgi:hypothetical protein